jgi:hypothetical protein
MNITEEILYQDKILKHLLEICKKYKLLHYYTFKKYKRRNNRFNLYTNVLTILYFPVNLIKNSYMPNTYIFLSMTGINIIRKLINFLSIIELLENHKISYIGFGKLIRDISIELTRPISYINPKRAEFIKKCETEVDIMLKEMSPIPNELLNKFEEIIIKHVNINNIYKKSLSRIEYKITSFPKQPKK